MFTDKRIAFVGGGMMATAMITGLLRDAVVEPQQITVSDINPARTDALSEQFGVRVTGDNTEAASGADVVVLAVKPQFFDEVAAEIAGRIDGAEVVLSIMAGVTLATIADKLAVDRVVRSIPNTPGAIGKGMTAYIEAESVSETGVQMAEAILHAIGETLHVPAERYIDLATAVSGSGPGFVFLFIESMIDAAVHLGFARADAEKLVLHTMEGTVAYTMESGTHPAILRNQVTSPGGTTAEGIYFLEKEGMRTAIARAMWASYQKSAILGGSTPHNPESPT